MTEKELADVLVKSGEGSRGKYAPWWDVDRGKCMYKYDLLSEESVREMTECAAGCSVEALSAPVGSYGLSMFHLLVWAGLYDAAADALKRGADANLPACAANVDPEYSCAGVTPLMLACSRGNLEMARLLLDNGADGGACDGKGRNSYHYLAGCRNKGMANDYNVQRNSLSQREPIARLLSGDVNVKDGQGLTPLQLILWNQNSTNYSMALTEIFMEKGADVHLVDENGNSLLMTAIGNRHMTAALKLMDDKGLINLPNRDGRTPLHLAVERHQMELCMALLEKGADKNLPDGGGKTPGELALEIQDADYKLLFTSGRLKLNTLGRLTSNAFAMFNPDERDRISMALYLAGRLIREVDEDDDDEVGLILEMLYSALMNDEQCRVLDMLKKAGFDFTAPIHVSGGVECIRDHCLGGNYGVKVIEKFLSFGMDMDEPLIKGRTPAGIVASQRARNMLGAEKDEYFEQAARFFSRESMEHVDDAGTTALHEAVRNNHVDMLKVMIEKGADVNVTQDEPADAGNTPLHAACAWGRAQAARLLMEAGADDGLQNVKGETPAHLAVMKKRFGSDLKAQDRLQVLEALNQVDIPGNDGKTPLILLQSLDINTVTEVQQLLLDKGADVNHADNMGNTALIAASRNYCYKGIIKELIRAGADINAADNMGNTALYYALKNGSQESACFLLKKGADFARANNEGVTPMDVAAEKGYDTVLELMA